MRVGKRKMTKAQFYAECVKLWAGLLLAIAALWAFPCLLNALCGRG